MFIERVIDKDGVAGVMWWIRLPRIPESIEDAKSLPEGGPIVFICDVEIYRGISTLHKLIDLLFEHNPDANIGVWHNHRRKKMKMFIRRSA